MRYPALIINKAKLEANTRFFIDICRTHGVELVAVTKCYCAVPELAEAQVKGGATMLADSRIENLKRLVNIPVPKMLIRIPMLSEVRDVVKYSDISLNSEIEVIRALSKEALKRNTKHKIMLMVDIGDLREGCLKEEALRLTDEIIKLEGIILTGIGANFACMGGVLPDRNNLGQLVEIADQIRKKHHITIDMISGGNSCTYSVMESGEMPSGVNHLRLGEIIILGFDAQNDSYVEGTYSDVFTLTAEMIEIKEKPSKPIGRIGIDGFGNIPVFPDYGIRKRAIFALGRQDVKIDAIFPRTSKARVIGGSSDHLVVDITECTEDFKVGDLMEFDLLYGSLLAVSTSKYVHKYIK